MISKPVNWKLNVFLMWITQIMVMTGFDASMTFIPLLFRDNFGLVEQAQRGVYVSIFNFVGFFAYAVFGWSTTFNNVGGMLSTLVSGWVIYISDARGVFIAAALLTALLIPVTLKGIKFAERQPYYIAHAGKKNT